VEKIILIGGTHGRNGTGIMKRMLATHPDVSSVTHDETQLMEALTRVLPFLQEDGGSYVPRQIGMALVDFQKYIVRRFGQSPRIRQLLDRLIDALDGTRVTIPRFGELPLVQPVPSQEVVRIFRSFVWDLIAEAMLESSAAYAVEKTPSNAQYIVQAYTYVPQSIMLVMTRHPLDVALSFLPHDWGPDHPIDAARYTHLYYQRWRYVKALVPRDYFEEFRLEDLIGDPQLLEQVFDFVGLTTGADVIHQARTLLRPTVDRRSTIPAHTLDHMTHILQESITDWEQNAQRRC
jgi:hypothetical protein